VPETPASVPDPAADTPHTDTEKRAN
jgi:hypothetical protein